MKNNLFAIYCFLTVPNGFGQGNSLWLTTTPPLLRCTCPPTKFSQKNLPDAGFPPDRATENPSMCVSPVPSVVLTSKRDWAEPIFGLKTNKLCRTSVSSGGFWQNPRTHLFDFTEACPTHTKPDSGVPFSGWNRRSRTDRTSTLPHCITTYTGCPAAVVLGRNRRRLNDAMHLGCLKLDGGFVIDSYI